MPDSTSDFDLITSPANPLVKQARQIAERRRARYRDGLFLVEGERAIRTVLDSGTDIPTVIVEDERRGDITAALVASLDSAGARVVALPSGLFAAIADAEHPQPIVVLARMPDREVPASPTLVVALDAVRDPGNLGTIVRTAAAAGVDAVALLPGCVDPFHPAAVRASAGTIALLPLLRVPSISELLDSNFAQPQHVRVIAADADAEVAYLDLDWVSPLILIAGSEAHGLSPETVQATTLLTRIPMAEGVESLNVAVATGILLFHARAVRSAS